MSKSSILAELKSFAKPAKSDLPKGFNKPSLDDLKAIKSIVAHESDYSEHCYAVMTLTTGEEIVCNLYGCPTAEDGAKLTLKGVRFREGKYPDLYCTLKSAEKKSKSK